MYRIGEKWKFEMPKDIIYTGIITAIVGKQIFIVTIKDEELGLNSDDIVQSRKLKRIDGGIDEENTYS